jgi:hypothetical protein
LVNTGAAGGLFAMTTTSNWSVMQAAFLSHTCAVRVVVPVTAMNPTGAVRVRDAAENVWKGALDAME